VPVPIKVMIYGSVRVLSSTTLAELFAD